VFDSVGNLPLHPLVLHAAVIGIPLTLLLSLLFALPMTRSWARWALPVVALGATGATFVARESGEALMTALLTGQQLTTDSAAFALVLRHSQLAGQLMLIMLAVAVLAVANAVVVGRVGGTAAQPGRPVRDLVLVALLVVAALVAAFWVYRVGDAGANAVWNPTGEQQYSTSGG
jgi:hypothetical protein